MMYNRYGFSGESYQSEVGTYYNIFVGYSYTSHSLSVVQVLSIYIMAQQFNRTMSLKTWPSMYGDYEFNDDDEDEDTNINWEQVKTNG